MFTALPDELYEEIKAFSNSIIQTMMEIYEGNTQRILTTSQVIITQVLCMIIECCKNEEDKKDTANRVCNSLKASISQNFPTITFGDEK